MTCFKTLRFFLIRPFKGFSWLSQDKIKPSAKREIVKAEGERNRVARYFFFYFLCRLYHHSWHNRLTRTPSTPIITMTCEIRRDKSLDWTSFVTISSVETSMKIPNLMKQELLNGVTSFTYPFWFLTVVFLAFLLRTLPDYWETLPRTWMLDHCTSQHRIVWVSEFSLTISKTKKYFSPTR